MAVRVLVLSRNDRWHKLEDLGARIVEWSGGLEGVEVETSHERSVLGTRDLASYDVCVLCVTMSELSDAEEQGLASFVAGGKVAYGIHSASVTDEDRETYIDLIGARFKHHPPHQSFQVKIVNGAHPVTEGVTDFALPDELYVLDRAPRNAAVLATARWEGADQPIVYVKPYGRGTVLYNALGHDAPAFDHPSFQRLVVQGLRWACQVMGA